MSVHPPVRRTGFHLLQPRLNEGVSFRTYMLDLVTKRFVEQGFAFSIDSPFRWRAASSHSARWGSGKDPTSSKAARGELLSPAHSMAQFERAALNTSIMAQSGQAPPRALPCAHRRPQVIAIQHLWCEMPRIERTVPRRRPGRVDDDSANAFSHRQSWLGTSSPM